MKKLLLLSLFAIAFLKINAQEVEATTTAGKKLMINLNNYTWRYAKPTDAQNPCYTNHTGTVNFHNQSSQDVYLYYKSGTFGNIEYVKINSGDSAILELRTGLGSSSGKAINHKWTAAYEFYNKINQTPGYKEIKEIKGFNAGNFMLSDCEPKEINIKD